MCKTQKIWQVSCAHFPGNAREAYLQSDDREKPVLSEVEEKCVFVQHFRPVTSVTPCEDAEGDRNLRPASVSVNDPSFLWCKF